MVAGGRVVAAQRSRSHVSYYVVMVGMLGLLALLCCYVCYFFISKIRELSRSELPPRGPPVPRAAPRAKEQAAYPVQPVVRDTATAMAALCRQLPAAAAGCGGQHGDQVFPAGRSPAPRPAHGSPPLPAHPPAGPPGDAAQDKLPPGAPCPGAEAPSAAVQAAS